MLPVILARQTQLLIARSRHLSSPRPWRPASSPWGPAWEWAAAEVGEVVWEEAWGEAVVGDVAWEEVWVAVGDVAWVVAAWILALVLQRQCPRRFFSHPEAPANRKNSGCLESEQRPWASGCKKLRSESVNWKRKKEPEVVMAGFSALSESALGRTDRRGETCS